MNKIKILSSEEAQKIAAGEVVEKPSNIVKETIENSIDANSSQISLYIEKAGKNLIRIVDNGCGMSPEDAKLCFYPHATSKISKIEDLEKISSFGFRGEALASIKSISKVTLITKRKEDSVGIKLENESGAFVESSVSTNVGTDLTIKDLFYNTPVRKKFLKQDETEWNQILNVFYAFCLSNLNIHFKIHKDKKLVLNLPAVENLKQRVSQIWGHNFSENLIQLKPDTETKSKNSLEFSGLISNHNFWRYGRQQIFFFVNNRYIKNRELSKALLKGYLNVLPPARFPAAFIFLTIDSDCVDINVHPRKEEVNFAKPGTIRNNLQKSVKETLENNLSKQFESLPQKKEINNPLTSSLQNKNITTDPLQKNENIEVIQEQISQKLNKENLTFNNSFNSIPDQIFNKPVFENSHEILKNASTFSTPFKNEKIAEEIIENKEIKVQSKAKIIGQLLNTYILFENSEGLVMIDQHAAHERILYEKYLKNFEQKGGIKLMFPQILNLSENQIKIVLKEKDLFVKQGIELEQIGESQLAIKSSPPKIESHSLEELILDAINFIQENEELEEEVFRKKLNEHVHSHMACKMAIKAGDFLNIDQMQKLIDDLQKVDNRFICVHGRPTTWNISKNEIEKKFRRK